MNPPSNLLNEALLVLDANDRSSYTQPAADLYPHQWLWDSCFIAIGLRHKDPKRAITEIKSLFRGQWKNGMMPNIIFNTDPAFSTDRSIWRSWISPFAPDGIATTGITQPPILAEAIVRIGEKLSWPERRQWYESIFPDLIKYHQWLYAERDPHKEGLILQIHPWEVGMDNTPPWMAELHDHQLSWWIRAIKQSRLDTVITKFRRDTKNIPSDERFNTIEALAMYDIQRRLRRKAYDINRILDHSMFAIEDVGFNAILIRNNQHIEDIAKSIKYDLPKSLLTNFRKTRQSFNQLWDNYSEQYFSRDFITHKLLNEPSIAGLLALYSGSIPNEHAKALVHSMKDRHSFATNYPLPSTPLNSYWYKANNYWQGPTWVNTNWLIIDGLLRYGFKQEAKDLRNSTLTMISSAGCYEYFNPEDGAGLGTPNFSWTAALAIDLMLNPI
jgi:neutral trehalase